MSENECRMIGGFRIEAELKSSGRQGRVYKAVCEVDDLPWCARGTVVALKTMQAGPDADAVWEKLRVQTERLAGMDHPNIVRYLGCMVEQSAFSELHVVVQEFLHGESLKSRLSLHPNGLDADEALKVIKGMVSGLVAATEIGIVHRDIKPDNVFLCSDGSVKIIDFEVSRQSDSTTTVSGNMVGSFDYMAPDFADPHFSGDEKSDIFSVGAVMHEILTGKLPYRRFAGLTQQASFAFLERWAKDDSGKFIRGACSVSTSVDRILAHMKPILVKALSLHRETRYGSFAEIKSELANVRFRDLKNGATGYRILQLIGKGGFGEVFKARSDGRTFAIKHLLKPEYASRFFREAKIMSELKDSCFVRFFDFFLIDHAGAKEAFLVMDFLPGMPGSSLRDAIRKSAGCGLDFASVMKAFIRYARGLKMIHGKGIYHRDIKPTNLYFPEDRPDAASIMDLGIARDQSGTETSGQVPGTLDYMPPETALGGTRGNAGMDIYALGLCLYEALSGKKGFPRLPTGSQGYVQFFQRAKEKLRPAFDDPRVSSNPGLLELLRKMTEPDLSDRLVDAARLEVELENVLQGGMAEAGKPLEVDGAAFSEPPEQANDEPETCETAFFPQCGRSKDTIKVIDDGLRKFDKKRNASHGRFFRFASCLLLCVAGALALLFFRSEIGCLVGKAFRVKMPQPDGLHTAASVFAGEDFSIPDIYGDDSSSIEQADSLRDRWLAERKPVISEHDYTRAVRYFEQKREQKVIRSRLDSADTRFDAEVKEVVQAYMERGVAAGDKRRKGWMDEWRDASRSKLNGAVRFFDKARNDRLAIDAAKDVLPRASASADKVAKSYADNGLKIADREMEVWKHEWSGKLLKQDNDKLVGLMAEARNRALGKIAEMERNVARRVLFSECRTLVEMLVPVQSRNNRLYEAEVKMQQAAAKGLVDEKERAAFAQEVNRAKRWTVFEIVNRTDLDLTVDGVSVKNATSHVFVFTNPPPESLSVECFGHESFPLGCHSDGKSITLLPEHFAKLKVSVSVGAMEEGVSCKVDGFSVKDSVIRLVPGSHECVYSKRDHKNQTIPFRIEPGVSISLPKPGPWHRSEDWLQREREKKRVARANILENDCKTLLRDEPISNRVARLAKCEKILRDWGTLDVFGVDKHKEISALHAAAKLRSLGAVVNDTGLDFESDVCGVKVKIPSNSRVVVEYPSGSRLNAKLCAHGYDPIFFPENFCGIDFRIDPSMVKPSQVEVSVKDMQDGVMISVDGKDIAGSSFMVYPGDYTIVYRRPDYKDIQSAVTVNVGEPLKLNCPYQWEASEGMLNLIAAEAAAESGDWNRVKTLLGDVKVYGADGIKRKMELNLRFEQRKRFVKRLDEAASAYYDERWHDVVKVHFDLKLDGYKMTKEDRERVSTAVKKRTAHLEMLKKIAGTGDFGASSEKINAEKRSFEVMAGLLAKEIEAKNGAWK